MADDPYIPVELVGGPDGWNGHVIRDVHRASELTLDAQSADELGTMLISGHPPPRDPDTEDIAPRAHYSPDPPPAPTAVWYFRGWVPAGKSDFRRPLPSNRVEVAVTVDHRGVPLGWTDSDATPWHVDRVHVHWIYDGEGAHGTDLSVWQVTAHSPDESADWELVHDAGAAGWAAAPLPGEQTAR